MSIPLSSERLQALRSVQDALLDPLSFATIEAWLLDVCARFEVLGGSAGTNYRLRAIRLPPGAMTRNEAILVVIQPVGPTVPETAELMQRFGLTRREADVAQRLAYGRSDREVAAELGLSRHTVRHHAESIFVKVGVTSRKALVLHLSSDT